MTEEGDPNAEWLRNLAAQLAEGLAQWEQLNQQAAELYGEGKFEKAVIFAKQALELALLLYMGNHPDVATSLNLLAELYHSQGRYEKAEPLYEEALAMIERLFKSDHPHVASSLNNLAELYDSQGRYEKAEPLYEDALAMRKRLFQGDHPDVASSLNNLAALYRSQGRKEKAEALYEDALAMRKRLFQGDHPDVASSLNNLAALYRSQGRKEKAEALYEDALAMRKRLFQGDHPDVATSLNNLAALYRSQGRYEKAEPLYEDALAMIKRLFKGDQPDVATSLNNLAALYRSQGRYEKAEPLYEDALAMRKRLFKGDHPDVATSLNNLAALYRSQGRYEKAEPLYEDALAMRKRLFKGDHPDVATSLNNLAALYRSQGRYEKAEPLLEEALAMRKRLYKGDHPDVASSLNNLAGLYKSQGRYEKAEPLLEEALAMRKRLFQGDHPDVAISLNNLAGLYDSQGRYEKAEPLYEEALAMIKRLYKGDHPYVAIILNNLALLYDSQGRYEKAEPLYEQALAMRKRLFQGDHPYVANSLNNLATLLAATNRRSQALELMKQANEVEDKMIPRVFSFSSESDRLAYLATIRGNFEALLSLIWRYFQNSPAAVQTALDVVLKRKSLTASAWAALSEALYSGRYPHLAEKFHKWRSLNTEIVQLTYSSPLPDTSLTLEQLKAQEAAHRERLSELQKESDNLEKLLASQVPEIQLQDRLADRRAVALELPEGSTLLEFVCFNVYDFTAPEGKRWQPARYVAFVLPAQQPDAVQMIDLGEAEPIDELIKKFRASASLGGDNLGSRLDPSWDTPAPAFPQYNPAGFIPQRQAIFDRIRPALTGCKSLIVSPDGELNLLQFQILPNDDAGETLLMDEYSISYLSVGRDILRSTVQPNRPASVPLIMADPDFDLAVRSQDFSPPSAKALTTNRDQILSTLDGKAFERAPGTRYLGESVAKKLNQQPYLDKNALETHLKTSQWPHILLLATHGVFLPDSPQEPPTFEFNSFNNNRLSAPKANNPMMRSGIALAGANTWIAGGDLPPDAGKGFLFAQDVAALDLWANELTVLSACNTAIGDVKIGEGVFGLRRAFAIAGAKTLVMSLWPVPDRATALLMQRFFDNLQRGLGRADALHDAQNYLRTITVGELRQFPLGMEVLDELLAENSPSCQEDDTPLSHPFYWGAWVCQGDTTPFRVEFAGAPN
ncbi:MAG: tetratricopeptide repeat protein [Oscillatoria princeps RMCB-10]|nr:tetratricopeptide repeat protein [Oscillatoria princeps RMCB-10]